MICSSAVPKSSLPQQLLARLHSHARASSSATCVTTGANGLRRGGAPAAWRIRCPTARRRRSLQVVAVSDPSSTYRPYPWRPDEYYQCSLQMVQTSGPIGMGVQQGYFLLMRVTEDDVVEDAERGLIMSVGGDTLAGVAQLAQGLPSGAAGGRPLALDLLWQVLERGQEISRRTWGVLRVAVVELRGNTFVGRVFFGDSASGVVAWDCDCRPSDACWLALKAGAPIFVHRSVWEESAMVLRDIQRDAEAQRAEAALREKTQEVVRLSEQLDAELAPSPGGKQPLTTTAMMTTPRAADPEPLKRLKMEMRVALKDEDYTAAARIRDHPWMRLHLSALRALQRGDSEEAGRCEAQLAAAISQHEEEEREGMKVREAEEEIRRRGQQQRDGGFGSGGGGTSPGRRFY